MTLNCLGTSITDPKSKNNAYFKSKMHNFCLFTEAIRTRRLIIIQAY